MYLGCRQPGAPYVAFDSPGQEKEEEKEEEKERKGGSSLARSRFHSFIHTFHVAPVHLGVMRQKSLASPSSRLHCGELPRSDQPHPLPLPPARSKPPLPCVKMQLRYLGTALL
jgi:hypothetical protein